MADPQDGLNTATNNTSVNLAPPSPAQPVDYNTLKIKCVWCLDLILSHEFLISECHNPGSHFICYPCIRQVFNLAADDGIMSAPRCCGTVLDINQPWLRAILGTELVAKYSEARKGYEVAPHAKLRAAHGVKAQHMKGRTVFWVKTNALQQRWHGRKVGNGVSDVAIGSTGTKVAITLSKSKDLGSKQSVGKMLMINSCECQAQWCYACGSVWKTCACNAFGLNDLVPVPNNNRIALEEVEQAERDVQRLHAEYLRIQDGRHEAFQRYANIIETQNDLRESGQEMGQDYSDLARYALHPAGREYLDAAREAHRAHYRWQAAQRVRDALRAVVDLQE